MIYAVGYDSWQVCWRCGGLSAWTSGSDPGLDAIGRVREMTYDNAEDYLNRAQEAAKSFDDEGRKEATRQFIDEKTFKPGLSAYDLGRKAGG